MNEKKPSIKQIEYFVTIARSSNFRKAATRLGISQPTLTTQISAMEEALGVQLFERSRAGTLLSPEGRELLPLARDMLEQYQHLLECASSGSHDLGGTFKLGVSSTIGPFLLPQLLPELHERYPELKLHLREGDPKDLERGLSKGQFDLIMTVLPIQHLENRVRPLFTEPVKIVVSQTHPFAGRESVSGSELSGQPVLTIDDHYHLHRQIAGLCERFGAKLMRDCEGNSLDTLSQMIMMDQGIGFLPELFVISEIKKGAKLSVLALEDEPLVRNHVAAWRTNASSRHLFQKLSYDIKAIAMEKFAGILTEVVTDENV